MASAAWDLQYQSRYLVNGKSIMGLFSLDLLAPVQLTIHAEKADDLVAELAPYLA